MGKINKYANIYKDGKLVRHVNDKGVLENYTIEEVEQLVDQLGNDKDENGKIKDKIAFNNANSWLFKMYSEHGNPHEEELLKALQEYKTKKTSKEEVEEKLRETIADVDERTAVDNDGEVPNGSTEERNAERDERGTPDKITNDPEDLVRPEINMEKYVDFEEITE